MKPLSMESGTKLGYVRCVQFYIDEIILMSSCGSSKVVKELDTSNAVRINFLKKDFLKR